ncbi:beta-glucosidase family protein [Sphingomonas sp. TDK1]|uniref:beta-glucosidase family protein n=1 Tax=Sphingomonas sp. TDK1 TaxID=453247 RepID=UPI0007D90A34|nr:glycoside hydrolase family 3 C-terminal domain-containing protein [Sphingomonas sp. TDK1]OAN62289.1 glycosyl hydrolase [Sphingomonas sp. TDK1]
MKKINLGWLVLGLMSGTAMAQTAPKGADPADARARATEAKMTDDERFQLLHGIMPIAFPGTPPLPRADLKPTAGWIPGVPRLGIPDLYETDASLGVANPLQLRKGDYSTALPSGLALAATWSPELAFKGGAVAGNETRQKGFNILLAGGVNLARDPRNGRNFEYLGEDPLLAGRLAGASIRGIQSQKVVSTIKHFALNDQETLRNTIDAQIDERPFRESDLLAFQLAIEDGKPGSVMCAYNRVNGDYACGNDFLLNQVLKRDWAFPGWVMSDWGAVHDVSYFAKGLDQQSGAQLDKQVFFDKPLRAEVAAGRVPMERVRESVRRILRSLYAVGADAPLAEGAIDEAAHAADARAVAAAGIVLLKNEGDVLPLAGAKSVAVIGGHADLGVLSGGGSSQVTPKGPVTVLPLGGRGMMGPWARQLYMPSSPLRALAAAMPGAKVEYDSGYDLAAATAFAKQSDVVIVFATAWSSEGSDFSMTLPEGQDALIAAVAAANPNTIVVLETGNPVKMPWLGKVKAVVEAWYPGQEGGAAIADVLTGKVNPSGRLPISFPADETQLPRAEIPGWGQPEGAPGTVRYPEGAEVGYRWYAGKGLKPLFPFGHGLSYTRFEQSGLQLRGGSQPSATVTVRNTGKVAGAEVVQLYLVGRGATEVHRLAGFARIALAPGEQRTVSIPIEPKILADWTAQGWRVPAATYRFVSAPSAMAAGLEASIALPARALGK